MSIGSFPAMGTLIEVHGEEGSLCAVRQIFSEYEMQFSRFISNSELSHINTSGRDGVAVSQGMNELLVTAEELCSRTNGLVDIGVGGAVSEWGYDRTFSDISDLSEEPERVGGTGWSIDNGFVRLSEDTQLDLGGLAKGWACDRAIDRGIADTVSAGGDVRSVDPSMKVEIVDEYDDLVTEIHLGVGALATSSTRKRRWRVGVREVHHLIDPRTMGPAVTPVLAASVVAGTAVEAEAGAKAVLLLGVDGLAWAERQPWIRSAIVRWHDNSVYAIAEKCAS